MVDCMKYTCQYVGSNSNTISSILVLCISIMKQLESKLRFKRKSYGRWWTPVSRHGRVVLGVYLLLVLWRVIRYSRMAQQDQQQREWTAWESDAWGNLVVALVPVFVLTLLLLLICYKKWETPKRQWWDKKESL